MLLDIYLLHRIHAFRLLDRALHEPRLGPKRHSLVEEHVWYVRWLVAGIAPCKLMKTVFMQRGGVLLDNGSVRHIEAWPAVGTCNTRHRASAKTIPKVHLEPVHEGCLPDPVLRPISTHNLDMDTSVSEDEVPPHFAIAATRFATFL